MLNHTGTAAGNYRPFEGENMSDRISRRVAAVPPSGIRKFFDIAATMRT